MTTEQPIEHQRQDVERVFLEAIATYIVNAQGTLKSAAFYAELDDDSGLMQKVFAWKAEDMLPFFTLTMQAADYSAASIRQTLEKAGVIQTSPVVSEEDLDAVNQS